MKKYKILALCGESCSGKSALVKKLCELNSSVNKIISCTTRPPRDGEVNGVDYYFITRDQFSQKVLSGEMLEATQFRDWFYGTPIEALKYDCVNVGIFNPAGIEIICEDERLEVIVCGLQCLDKIRLQRQLERTKEPDCEEICRRFLADKQDFTQEFWNDYVDIVFDNNTESDLYNILDNLGINY